MEYFIHVAIIATFYAGLALSLNLLMGYTGILSVCHAAFYGVGAYATAILMKTYGVDFFLSTAIGAGVAVLISLFVGVVLSKVERDYYALGSFGFGIIVYSLLLNWGSLTGGALGIFGIQRPEVFGYVLKSNVSFLIFSLVVVGIIMALAFSITRSHFGRVLRAVRDDEEILIAFGYQSYWYKLIIFILAAAFASVMGSLYAVYISFIDPSSFTINESIYILTIVILGGLASLRGSILGAVVLTLLPEFLRFVGLPNDVAAQLRVVLYGVALMYLMYLRPWGLIGKYTP